MRKILSLVALATCLQAESIQYTEYISVQSSTPQYELVSQRQPYQECHSERVAIDQPRYAQDNVIGSVVGGAIGGVVGHQIGAGRGNDIATVGGAILGTIVGGNAMGNSRAFDAPRYETRQDCSTRYKQSRSHRELVGYENIGYYKGKRIVKFSDRKLREIPLTVTIDY